MSSFANPNQEQVPGYVSVDIESAGPIPGQFALLSIGACLVFDPSQTFYAELQPDAVESDPQALEISGLSLETLHQTGLPPAEAMQRFADWLDTIFPNGDQPIFVAFNAPFDWMFINTYFHRYLGHNPFGHSALDIKAFYMGLRHTDWPDTSFHKIAAVYGQKDHLNHNALEDAVDQARLFHRMLLEAKTKKGSRL